MALDERSTTEFARSMAYRDADDTSHCPVAIVAGAHRNYIACIFAQLLDMDHEIRMFGATDEAVRITAPEGLGPEPQRLPCAS
jgi:hypothetical protein